MANVSRPLAPAPTRPIGAPVAVEHLPSVLPADEPATRIRKDFPDLPSVLPADALVLEAPLEVVPAAPARAWPIRFAIRTWQFIGSVSEWIFGAGILIIGLAVLASLPILQFLSLGYLLEATGRVARSGRLRDGFPGVRKAARAGSIVLGTTLMILPLQIVSSYCISAAIIDPDGPTARGWKFALTCLAVLVALHVAVACARGGKLRYFFWPFNFIWLVRRLWRGGLYTASRDAVWDFAMGLRLPYYFWLGLRGFVGAFAWLAVPVTLLALGRFFAPLGFLGAFLLMAVLLYLLPLQAQFARENRLRAHFDFFGARQAFRRAPWAFAFAFFITLVFAVPLYLLKIEYVQRELAWLPGIFFIAFMFPARLLSGWALGRSRKPPGPRHWFFRWTGRLAMIPVTVVFVIIVYFSQFVLWGGVWSLYEQHAFLLPVPFVGM
jgi:hypothetical protein